MITSALRLRDVWIYLIFHLLTILVILIVLMVSIICSVVLFIVFLYFSRFSMENFNLKSKLLHLLLDFTELSTASVYRVTVMHPNGCSPDVAIVMSRCVIKLSQFYLCTESGDCATSYLVVSHLAPTQFETMLQKSFDIQIRPFRQHGIYTLVF